MSAGNTFRCSGAVITTLFLTILSLSAASAANPAIYFTANLTPQSDPAAVTPLERALLDQIDSAATTIDAALYEFDRPSLRDGLLAAHARGVRVRIVTDDQTHYSVDDWPIYSALEAAGIPVVDDYGLGGSLRVHDKYLILDGQKVWTGSTNFTIGDLARNHNNSLLFSSPALAQLYQFDFDQLYTRRFGSAKAASPVTSISHNGWPLEVYFSPQDAALDRIIAEVEAAQSTIDFAILQFKDDPLRDAVLAADARGVQVRGLMDAGSAGDSDSDDEALCAAGAAIKIEGTPGRLHNKFMLIDASTPRERLITGSLNWTEAARIGSSENSLILHEPALVDAYIQTFETMWALIPVDAQCNVAPPPASTDWIYLPSAAR